MGILLLGFFATLVGAGVIGAAVGGISGAIKNAKERKAQASQPKQELEEKEEELEEEPEEEKEKELEEVRANKIGYTCLQQDPANAFSRFFILLPLFLNGTCLFP